jgi:hypothetical protein
MRAADWFLRINETTATLSQTLLAGSAFQLYKLGRMASFEMRVPATAQSRVWVADLRFSRDLDPVDTRFRCGRSYLH